MLRLIDIDKTFNKGTVNEAKLFEDFSLTVKSGEFLSVVGSNGSGKTTMLNIIGGSCPIDGGKVELDGTDITKMPEYRRARKIGRVFQNPAQGTVPSMTVAENLAVAKLKGRHCGLTAAIGRSERENLRVLAASLGLGLEDRMNVPVGLLSGGQRQALTLLMCTLTPIDLLLLDEHTAALDPKTAEQIMELTDRIVREKKLTAIMVTHNLRYAVEYGNRMIMMHSGGTVLDVSDDEKKKTKVEDILGLFNSISIECGN